MKKLSLLLGLFILAVMLCDPADTLPKHDQTEAKAESQPQTSLVAPAELTRELTSTKLSNSEFKLPALLREAPEMETPETAPAEPDEHSMVPTSRPEPATESKPEKPAVKEVASAVIQSESGLPGFDYVPYLGPNVVIYVEDMYENGNKIGIMGDINKQVGIMD